MPFEINLRKSFCIILLNEFHASMSQAQFSQMRPMAMTPSVGPRMPMFPPGAPGIGQQIFYGQAPPMIPPQVKTL